MSSICWKKLKIQKQQFHHSPWKNPAGPRQYLFHQEQEASLPVYHNPSSNQSVPKEINPECTGKDWCWIFNTLATWCEELAHWRKTLMLGKIEGRRRSGRQWNTLLTQWTWVWANSGRWWRTKKPGMLKSIGLQRVGHDWATEQLAPVDLAGRQGKKTK